MNIELKILLLTTIGLLVVLLLGLLIRLFGVLLRRRRERKNAPESDLLYETLREQTLREQEAARGRSLAQEAYASLEALHETILTHIPIGVLVLREDHSLDFINPHGREILAIQPAGEAPLARLCPPLHEACAALGWGSVAGPRSFTRVVEGSQRVLALSIVSLPADRRLLTVTDVTRVQHLEERVRAKRDLELMGEMASGITHELKNALATISGHVQLLPYGEVDEHARYIMHEVDHLLRFVRLFSRSTRGENLDTHPILLRNWLAEVAEHWLSHPQGAQVRVEVPTSELQVTGDRTLLTSVVHNLVLNGVQAGAEGAGAVRVFVRVEHGGVALVVEDQGPGFAPEIRARMFSPFVSAKPGGTGLGLFQCRKIMMEHQGRLSVDHGPPTRVICHFPQDFDPISPPS